MCVCVCVCVEQLHRVVPSSLDTKEVENVSLLVKDLANMG